MIENLNPAAAIASSPNQDGFGYDPTIPIDAGSSFNDNSKENEAEAESNVLMTPIATTSTCNGITEPSTSIEHSNLNVETLPYVCVPTIVPVSPIMNSSPPSPNTDSTPINPQLRKVSADSDSIYSDSSDSDSDSSDSDSDSSDSDSSDSDSDSSDSDSSDSESTASTARSITPTNANTKSNTSLSLAIVASSSKRISDDVTSSSESDESDSSIDTAPSEPKKKKTADTSVSIDVTDMISNKTKTGPLTKLNGVFGNKGTFKALREQMELRNEYMRNCRAVTVPLRDEWTPNTQHERFDGRKVVIRRPADWVPGTEYKPFVSGKSDADSNTLPFPRPKLWQQTMELQKQKRLSKEDSKKGHASSATM